jgi:tetratricopeptide (TPR) repeat protein
MQTRRTLYRVLHCLFIALLFQSQLTAQDEDPEALLPKIEKLEDSDSNKVYNYCNVALKLTNNAEYEKAFRIISKVGPIVPKCHNPRMEALYHYISGYVNYSLQNYTESLSHLISASKLYEQLNNKGKQAACKTIIGFIYQDQKIYDKAAVFFKSALDLRLEIKDSLNLAPAYSNLGLNYYKIAQQKKEVGGKNFVMKNLYEFKEAFYYFELSLQIARQFKLPSAEANALGNLSNMMNDKGDHKEAEKYAREALETYREMGDVYNETVSLIDIGSVYYMQSKNREALPWFNRALELASGNKFPDLERYIYENLRNVHERLGDYKAAYTNLYKEKVLQDTLFNQENLRQINDMQIKYETEKKEAENALLLTKNELSDKAIKNQKNIIIFIIGGLILSLVFAFFIFRGLKKQKQANRIISQQKKEVEDKNILIHSQKELLEEKQKEIYDSINYARRIQGAHLPTEKYIVKSLDRLRKQMSDILKTP